MIGKTRLDNSTYNILRALGKEVDFLYSTIDKYIEDANKDNRTHLVEIWNELKTCRTYISSISKNILELLWWCPCAKACWGIANATAVIATAATIAAAKNIISKKKRTS